ncbi:hypothetical protein L7F22_067159 [Adiantum nelumboides]|nr:hypothetical protein [Adiantum nelumboides]
MRPSSRQRTTTRVCIIRAEDHRIELVPGAEPPSQFCYRLSKALEWELETQIEDLSQAGFVRPSSSSFATPVLFVMKKDMAARLCVDYRALNKLTIEKKFPLPHTEYILERLDSAKFFTKIDLKSGYHQIRIFGADIPKTAFRKDLGLYEFVIQGATSPKYRGQCRGYRELKTEQKQRKTRNYRGWLCSVLDSLWLIRDKDSGLLRIPYLQTVLGRVLRRYVAQIPPIKIKTAGYRQVKAVDTFFYWPTLRRDVDAFVRECITCQKVKFDRQKAPGLLQPPPIPDTPWESIAMDFIFDLPRTQTGNDGIWTIICRFSKLAHFILVKKKIKPDQMARLFMSNIFKYHGMPQSIVSDHDPRMTSLFWRGLFENLGTMLKFSSSFHPQTDGQSEEANSTILDLLKCYVSEHKESGSSICH